MRKSGGLYLDALENTLSSISYSYLGVYAIYEQVGEEEEHN